MKKIINKKEYNTETSTMIMNYINGCFGDPAGYEETLYQTAEGLYFLYVNGGQNSIHPKEDIIRLAKTKVSAWIDSHK